MIQDILPKHLKNEYIPKQPAADSYVLGFHDRTVYLKEQDGEITFLTYGEWENYCREKKGVEELSSVYLFSIDEKAFFLTDIRPEDENAMEGFGHPDVCNEKYAPEGEHLCHCNGLAFVCVVQGQSVLRKMCHKACA